jgi:hypothetical protein
MILDFVNQMLDGFLLRHLINRVILTPATKTPFSALPSLALAEKDLLFVEGVHIGYLIPRTSKLSFAINSVPGTCFHVIHELSGIEQTGIL